MKMQAWKSAGKVNLLPGGTGEECYPETNFAFGRQVKSENLNDYGNSVFDF